jgi:4-hydroxythreonine-4-phosphate dehydrogenase
MSGPRIGLMLGDVTGIGPEICARLLAAGQVQKLAQIVVVGDARVLELGMNDAGVRFPWRAYTTLEEIDWARPEVPLVDLKNLDPGTLTRGEVSAESGRVTGETLAYMIEQALEGSLDAVTFAPLNKAALNAGGWRYPDEHQLFAKLTAHEGYFGEMNVLGDLWTSRVTSHIPFKQVVGLLTRERIIAAIRLAHGTLKAAGVASPRLAVAALNPHAGEGGLFGDEEERIIEPAVAEAQREGVNCSGPFPADTIFLKAFAGHYDGVVSMYHDQGQIAMKLRGFNQGVTVTAGLRTVFTTPAHGTAFDIVGRGQADTGALEQALKLAATLASSRRSLPG